ncbi:phage baseplate upper protein [Bacillus sp. NPDC093026]|uniref:phage baseplate upper protein n=1 Tax=Bacillus sp. NPDC093026 TaxID=3363948 RepID=UPI003827143E
MISKNGALEFNVNAYTSSSISTSINFWTQDRKTARLVFKLTKDGVPLPLAAVTGKLVLAMADGSQFIRNITIIDRVEGFAEYVLSDQEIKHYGTVKAELNLYYANDQSMSVHQFSFNISKSLVDQNIVPITEYYVDEFEALKAKINQLYDESIHTIDELRAKFADLEKIETKEGAQAKVDAHANNSDVHVTAQKKAEWDAKETPSGAQAKVNTHANDAAKHVTSEERAAWNAKETPAGAENKAAAALEASKEYVDTHIENKKIHVTESEKSNWNNAQLYKLTPNDGKVARLPNGTDIFSLSTGFYMGANLVNTPISNDGSFYYVEVLETAYSQDGVNYKRIIVTRSFDNLTWIGTFHAQGFRGWKRMLTDADANVAWVTPSLSNGWKQYVSPDGFPHTLRYSKDAMGVVEIIGSIYGGTLGNDVPAFTLPAGYRPLQSTHLIGVASSIGTSGVPQYHRTYIGTDGRVCIQSSSNTSNPTEFITFGFRFRSA